MKEGRFQTFISFGKKVEQPHINFFKRLFSDHPSSDNHQKHSIDQRNIEPYKSQSKQKNSERKPNCNRDAIYNFQFSQEPNLGDMKQMNCPFVSVFEFMKHQSRKDKSQEYCPEYKKSTRKMQEKISDLAFFSQISML